MTEDFILGFQGGTLATSLIWVVIFWAVVRR